jgi:hypothetical protein
VLQCLQHAVSRCVCGVCADFDWRVPRAGRTDDLWRLSLATLEWTSIEVPLGARPSARSGHVMTSVGLDLWVYGAYTDSGEGDTCATHVTLLLLSH